MNSKLDGLNGKIDKMEVEMNIFCDASPQAYRVIAFYVFFFFFLVNNTRKTCSFVLSKSYLLPLKDQGSIIIPKLELHAAVPAVRLKNTILDKIHIKITRIRFWTALKITLSFFKNLSKKFSAYITNHLNEIRGNSVHIPGK